MCFSSVLLNKPKFISGMMRIFDMGATYTDYNSKKSGLEIDRQAFYSDFYAVGEDLKEATGEFVKTYVK